MVQYTLICKITVKKNEEYNWSENSSYYENHEEQRMESYGKFASVYDMFQDNVNYREWTEYIVETLTQDEIKDGL